MTAECAKICWLFDLDNTLHQADAGIFYLINRHMTAYLADALHLSDTAASDLRQDYWHRYGATLAGLQIHHPQVEVMDFLRQSHPLPSILSALKPMPDVHTVLPLLMGKKAVFSNGPSFYVRALCDAMGIVAAFDALFGTDDFGLLYKPNPQAFIHVCTRWGVAPTQCIMVDDSADNLHAAKALGMRTVWFGTQAHTLPFVDVAVADMMHLLAAQTTLMSHTAIRCDAISLQ